MWTSSRHALPPDAHQAQPRLREDCSPAMRPFSRTTTGMPRSARSRSSFLVRGFDQFCDRRLQGENALSLECVMNGLAFTLTLPLKDRDLALAY